MTQGGFDWDETGPGFTSRVYFDRHVVLTATLPVPPVFTPEPDGVQRIFKWSKKDGAARSYHFASKIWGTREDDCDENDPTYPDGPLDVALLLRRDDGKIATLMSTTTYFEDEREEDLMTTRGRHYHYTALHHTVSTIQDVELRFTASLEIQFAMPQDPDCPCDRNMGGTLTHVNFGVEKQEQGSPTGESRQAEETDGYKQLLYGNSALSWR